MPITPQDLMRFALEVASSGKSDDLPIASVIVDSAGKLVASASNSVVETGDFTAHAELLVLGQLRSAHLRHENRDLTIVVTLEPCPMCAWAIRISGLGRLLFGAYNQQYGAAGSVFDLARETRHGQPLEVIGGIMEEECRSLIGAAFLKIRDNKKR